MILDGEIHLVRLETVTSRLFAYRTFVAWVDGLLVDSGFARARRQLLAALEERHVDQIVNTHAHEDHCGNNQVIATKFGAALRAPIESLAELAQPARRRFYSRAMFGTPQPSWAEPLGEHVTTPRFRFEVMSTPGHSLDHVCFYERERGWLFGGDLFLAAKVQLGFAFENAADHIESLRKVLSLRPRLFVCYHRGPIADPCGALRTKLAWLEEMRGRALEAEAGGASVREITRSLLGRASSRAVLLFVSTLGDMSRRHLVTSLLREPGTGYRPPLQLTAGTPFA